MYCDSGIAEYRHSVDGLERIDSVLFLTDLQEEEMPELLELARVAILDSKSRRYLAWPAGRHVQELRWFVSVDLKYIIIKHISESPDEWSLMQGPQGLRFKFPFKGSFHEIVRDLRDYLEKR